MKYLLDTHLLIWLAEEDARLSMDARALITHPASQLFFSVASIWELSIKSGIHSANFRVDVALLRTALLKSGFIELPILSRHALAVAELPLIHRDPFDRILLAQAGVDGMILMTVDRKIAQYPGPILRV